MKFLFAAIFCLVLSPTSVLSNEYQPGYSRSRTCTKSEYREEYVPGTQESPGYVRSWTETIEVACNPHNTGTVRQSVPQNIDDNDCKEGSLIGGILGAGITMSATQGKDRWWAVPAGGITGSMIGCQIDGG